MLLFGAAVGGDQGAYDTGASATNDLDEGGLDDLLSELNLDGGGGGGGAPAAGESRCMSMHLSNGFGRRGH